jgi:hypothetical protein
MFSWMPASGDQGSSEKQLGLIVPQLAKRLSIVVKHKMAL